MLSTDSIDRREKFTHSYEGWTSPHASALHWNPPGFSKRNKIGYFSNRSRNKHEWLHLLGIQNENLRKYNGLIIINIISCPWLSTKMRVLNTYITTARKSMATSITIRVRLIISKPWRPFLEIKDCSLILPVPFINHEMRLQCKTLGMQTWCNTKSKV